jgi:hypothetical protein
LKEVKIGLFLGAGASVPYGKPTTQVLKNELMKKYTNLASESNNSDYYYIQSIIGFPEFKDIEHVLQCIKEVDDFFTLSRYGAYYLLNHNLQFQFPGRPWGLQTLTDRTKDIRRMLEDDVFENYAWDYSVDPELDTIFDSLFSLIKSKSNEIQVFTTNYDRAVEEYCSKREKNCRCIDGFQSDEYSNRRIWGRGYSRPAAEGKMNVYLYKLHGSLNWKRHKSYGIEATGEERRSSDSNYVENLLVYPTLSPKDGTEIEPYKTIREEFKRFMETADACIIIGFSFRDSHLNMIFSDFLKRGKRIIAVSPSADENIYTNLLERKDISEPEVLEAKTSQEMVYLLRENRTVVTINQPLKPNNIADVSILITAAIRSLFT